MAGAAAGTTAWTGGGAGAVTGHGQRLLVVGEVPQRVGEGEAAE